MLGTGTKEIIVLDVDGGGFPDNELIYLGDHMMNDPQLIIPEDEKDKNTSNLGIDHYLALVAEKVNHIGDEITATISIFK